MNKPESNISIACGSLVLAAAMAIAGCNGRDENDRIPDLPAICASPCAIDIELPDDSGKPPQAPPVTEVEAGIEVNFRLPRGGGQPPGRTVLSFEEPALQDNQGNPLYTLELKGASNRFTARTGVCKPDKNPNKTGCRYVVINVGLPGRPSVISSPRFVIR